MDVARIRKRLGLTQARLARLTGVHTMTVSKWERGVLAPNPHQRAILAALAGRGAGDSEPARELAEFLNGAFLEVTEVQGMKLSASNQIKGKIIEMETGPVSTRVVLEIAPRVKITSVITTASARRLGLEIGKRVVAIIKATEVILGA
jgi:molybdopterin-binding protein